MGFLVLQELKGHRAIQPLGASDEFPHTLEIGDVDKAAQFGRIFPCNINSGQLI